MEELLHSWVTLSLPPPPGYPDGGKAVEGKQWRRSGEPRQPEVVDEARGGPRLPEEGEQLGEGDIQYGR